MEPTAPETSTSPLTATGVELMKVSELRFPPVDISPAPAPSFGTLRSEPSEMEPMLSVATMLPDEAPVPPVTAVPCRLTEPIVPPMPTWPEFAPLPPVMPPPVMVSEPRLTPKPVQC